jgi:NADH:ubiquinone oxidoreductase subunit E
MKRLKSAVELEKLRTNILTQRKPGKQCIAICKYTGFHRRRERIKAATANKLGISIVGATSDYRFGLEEIAHFGSSAPNTVISIDNNVCARLTPASAKYIQQVLEVRDELR